MSKILIPVDGSPASLRALDFAIDMARRNPDTSLVLLNVQTITASDAASAAMGGEAHHHKASHASARAVEPAAKKCEAGSIRFNTLVKTGLVAEAIAEVAESEGVNHIVMGTRGLGSIQGLLLGSVAMKVVHLAEVPITLIK